MNDLILALYNFAAERDMETRFITDVAEYRSGKNMSDRAYDKLLPMLDKAAEEQLDLFLDERLGYENLERESIFTAGLSIGLALSRLG